MDPAEASVVQRIYALYLEGQGYSGIAKILNREAVPPPKAGRRGSGTWTHSAIRAMLMRPKYRGLYVHGKVNRTRRGGGRVATQADPSEVMQIEKPDWRIIDDITWFRVQDEIRSRAPKPSEKSTGRRTAPSAKYALSHIGRCASCGLGIGVGQTKVSGGKRVRSYVCTGFQKKGKAVCPVNLSQPMAEVDEAIARHLRDHVLTRSMVQRLIEEIDSELSRELSGPRREAEEIVDELRVLKSEQSRLAKAVALSGDIAELVSELRKRNERIRRLEAEQQAALRTPETVRRLIAEVRATALTRAEELTSALVSDPSGAREFYLKLFPDGLQFSEARKGKRRVWAISGEAHLGSSNSLSDPTGT